MSDGDIASIVDLLAWLAVAYSVIAFLYMLCHLPGSMKFLEEYLWQIGIGVVAGLYLKSRHC